MKRTNHLRKHIEHGLKNICLKHTNKLKSNVYFKQKKKFLNLICLKWICLQSKGIFGKHVLNKTLRTKLLFINKKLSLCQTPIIDNTRFLSCNNKV